MFCNQCGHKRSTNANFCNNCGNKFNNQAILTQNIENNDVAVSSDVSYMQQKIKASAPKNKKKLMAILIAIAALIISPIMYFVLTQFTPKIEVEAYYPQSGSAGTYVLLALNQEIDQDKISVFYGEEEIPGAKITDCVIGVNIPVDAVSSDIMIKYNRRQTKVPFEILEKEMITLLEETIKPSTNVQHINADGEVSVTLPSQFLDEDRTISISKVINAPVLKESPLDTYEVYDISIAGMTQLKENIKISMKYNPAWFEEGDVIEDMIEPKRWDEENGVWAHLYYYVDEDTHTVHFLTDHLSFFALSVNATGLLQAMAVSGTVAYALEWIANDVYISPGNKVRILYSKKAVSEMFPDKEWEKMMSHMRIPRLPGYRYIYPFMVQDIGNILDYSLKAYIDAGFSDPTTDRFGGSVFKRRVKVKIDSYYNFYTSGEFSYQAFWDQINVPSEIILYEVFNPVLNNPSEHKKSGEFLTHVLAHELFHAIQRPYYGMLTDYRKGKHLWWMEATADYASNDIVWKRTDAVLNERLGSRFFDYPLNATGRKQGSAKQNTNYEYEYLSAVFVRYLVEELQMKLDFKTLIKYVADKGIHKEPLESITAFVVDYLGNEPFEIVYGEFVAWLLGQGTLKVADFDKIEDKGSVSEKSHTAYIPDKEAIIKIETTQASDTSVLIYKSEGYVPDEKVNMHKATVLKKATDIYEMTIKSGEILYFIVPNVSDSDRQVSINVLLIDDENSQERKLAENSLVVPKNHTAKVWAVKFEDSDWTIDPTTIENGEFNKAYTFTIKGKQISKDIKNVNIEYDFGDDNKNSKGSVSGTVEADGTLTLQIPYVYVLTEDTKMQEKYVYTVNANIMTGQSQIATVEAVVTLNPIAVSIMPPRIMTYTLAKGATEAEHNFNAVVTPKGEYRFEWDFGDGTAKRSTRGQESTVTHAYHKVGRFHPQVTVYAGDNNVLAQDSITIILEKEDTEDPYRKFDSGFFQFDYDKLYFEELDKFVRYKNVDTHALEGMSITFYDAERTKPRMITYVMDRKTVGRENYNEDGTPQDKKYDYSRDGSVYSHYYEYKKGHLIRETNTKDNKSHGVQMFIYGFQEESMTGTITYMETFEGKKHGILKNSFENVVIGKEPIAWESIVFYKEDEFHGTYETFFSDGRPKVIATYFEGQKDGEYKEYRKATDASKDYFLYREATYKQGIPDGQFVEYSYIGGEARVYIRSFWENGVKRKNEFYNITPTGNVFYMIEDIYDENGQKVKSTKYYYKEDGTVRRTEELKL